MRSRSQESDGHAIQRPGRRLLQDIPLAFVEKRRGNAKPVDHALSLTAFIDFLLVTVIFLLMTFSADGEFVPDRNIALAEAENGEEMIAAPLVSVDGNQVRLNGNQVDSAREAYDAPGLVKLDGLFTQLRQIRLNHELVNPRVQFAGVCILQIDQAVPAKVVKSIFHTAAMAGYGSISFMVKPAQRVVR